MAENILVAEFKAKRKRGRRVSPRWLSRRMMQLVKEHYPVPSSDSILIIHAAADIIEGAVKNLKEGEKKTFLVDDTLAANNDYIVDGLNPLGDGTVLGTTDNIDDVIIPTINDVVIPVGLNF